MSNSITFSHNFCESRLNDNVGPEYFNAVSSLFITAVPLICGVSIKPDFKKVGIMLVINGGCSFYYHFTLSWFGKQLDEITMLMANYYYINGLLPYCCEIKTANTNMISNTILLPIIIAVNTIPQNDIYFPYIFSIYCIPTCFYIVTTAIKKNLLNEVMLYNLLSIWGAVAWFISEYDCTPLTTYGHIIWHLCFPLGIYKTLKLYDDAV
jgi:hypothetical protein